MGTVLASAVIEKASLALMDVSNVRWTAAELLKWLNLGQRQIVQVVPTANNVMAAVPVVAGSRQSLPATAWTLLDITRNMGAGGATPGRAIRVVSQELMDLFDPDWHTATATTVVQNYVYNPLDSLNYYVYPPSLGTWYVEMNYSAIPADIAAGTAITISDAYEGSLLDYILFRACAKDAEYAPGVALAQMYLQLFTAALTAAGSGEQQGNPNNDLSAGTPTPRGTS